MKGNTLFGDNLKQLRQNANLTQDQLAQKLKTTKQTINRYETGQREPDFDRLVEIAHIFNVSLDWLLGKT